MSINDVFSWYWQRITSFGWVLTLVIGFALLACVVMGFFLIRNSSINVFFILSRLFMLISLVLVIFAAFAFSNMDYTTF
jgi:hypothetical protein